MLQVRNEISSKWNSLEMLLLIIVQNVISLE